MQIRRRGKAEFEVDPFTEGPIGAKRARAERAEVVPRRQHEIGGDDFRAGLFVHLAREFQKGIHGALRLGLHEFARVGELAGVKAAAFGGQDEYDLRRKRIKFAVVVHDLGQVIVVIALPEFDRMIFQFAQVLDEFVQRIEAVTADKREA